MHRSNLCILRCDKTNSNLREDRRKEQIIEERDVQAGEIKWFHNVELKQCQKITGAGSVGCFVEQYPEAVCAEGKTASGEDAYRCVMDFPGQKPIAPYTYDVLYAKSAPHHPVEVYRSDLAKTVTGGYFKISIFKTPKTISEKVFAAPCKP
jgi:hypothetical protein